jgi:Na+/proline symporter
METIVAFIVIVGLLFWLVTNPKDFFYRCIVGVGVALICFFLLVSFLGPTFSVVVSFLGGVFGQAFVQSANKVGKDVAQSVSQGVGEAISKSMYNEDTKK